MQQTLQLESYCAWLQAKQIRMYTYDSVPLHTRIWCATLLLTIWPTILIKKACPSHKCGILNQCMHEMTLTIYVPVLVVCMWGRDTYLLQINLSYIQDHLSLLAWCAFVHTIIVIKSIVTPWNFTWHSVSWFEVSWFINPVCNCWAVLPHSIDSIVCAFSMLRCLPEAFILSMGIPSWVILFSLSLV